jgi:DNA-binding CsgD family transcriptional regulator
VEYEFAIHQGNYEFIYIFPYIFAILIAFLISYKTKRHLFSILSTCISLIGIGLLFLLISEENVFLSNFFMHFGFGILDIIIWGAIIYLIYIYNNVYKIPSLLMIFQGLGVLIGGIISEYYIDKRKVVYVIAIICIFISIILVPKVSDITIKKLDSKKKLMDEEKNKIAKLQSKERYKLLSNREKEVVNLILLDKINREIAKIMNISETTVKTHCKNIYIKLGLKNKKELKSIFKDDFR